MSYLVVRSVVENYSKWKKHFDANAAVRKEAGSQGGYVFRVNGEPNEVVVTLQFDSHERARTFVGSPELRAVMAEAGVIGHPESLFLDRVDRPEA